MGRITIKFTVVVAHLGGGMTISLHHHGCIIDVLNDDDSSFTPERAGAVPMTAFIHKIFREQLDEKAVIKLLKTKGCLTSHLGVNDLREVEKMIVDGNEYAELELVYEAMAMNVAKNIVFDQEGDQWLYEEVFPHFMANNDCTRILTSKVMQEMNNCPMHRVVKMWFDGPTAWNHIAVKTADKIKKPLWASEGDVFPYLKSAVFLYWIIQLWMYTVCIMVFMLPWKLQVCEKF